MRRSRSRVPWSTRTDSDRTAWGRNPVSASRPTGVWSSDRPSPAWAQRPGDALIEDGGELGVSIADKKAERRRSLAKVDQKVASLLSGPRAGRVAGHTQNVHPRVWTSTTNNTYRRFGKIVST